MTTSISKTLCAAALTSALVSGAHASAARTFVSGLGNDSNTGSNCPRATPCRTLAQALTVTSSGGEIVAIDAAGYGTISISGPLVLTGSPGASISVSTGTTGIAIAAGSTDKVLIRGFEISGAGAASTTGIQLTSGRLVLQDSSLELLTTGLVIAASTKSDVISTNIMGNTTGISTSGTGTNFDTGSNPPPWGPTQVRIRGGSVVDNATGFIMNSPGNDQFQVFYTILMSNPQTTDTAGNAALVSCTGINQVNGNTPPCGQVGQYSLSISNSNQTP